MNRLQDSIYFSTLNSARSTHPKSNCCYFRCYFFLLPIDNFREDQANEYTTLKKDLEVTTKNCRILSFKLKKSERKIEQLETEKQSSAPAALISQIKQLEEELKISNDRLQQMQVCVPTPIQFFVIGIN